MSETVFGLRRRADRMLTVFQKTHPWGTFLKDFGVILGAKSRYFGDFWGDDGTFFRRWVRSRCQGHENRRAQARTHIKAEGKVYLSDKAYD